MIITKTPLRITFAGGGSDMASYYLRYPATCISATINKYVYVLVKKRFDDKIYLKYRDKGFEYVSINIDSPRSMAKVKSFVKFAD